MGKEIFSQCQEQSLSDVNDGDFAVIQLWHLIRDVWETVSSDGSKSCCRKRGQMEDIQKMCGYL